MPETLVAKALHAAVAAMGGAQRPGQVEMSGAVASSLATGEHLLVQAGTGTGKSLGYLIPALVHVSQTSGEKVVVATATLALQAQLASKDIPTALAAVAEVTGKRPRTAVLKGRSNYACLHRVRTGGIDDQNSLLGASDIVDSLRASSAGAESVLGAEVLQLREWAEDQRERGKLADRDDAPPHSPRAWAQVSVPVRECLGKQACPFGEECLVEKSRELARGADLVVTNHALLAIDAMHGGTALPEHDHVIIDEAHELVSRVTGAASAELSPQLLDRVARRAISYVDDQLSIDVLDQVDALQLALAEAPLAQVEETHVELITVLGLIRDVSRRCCSAMESADAEPDQKQAAAAMKEIFDVSERMAKLSVDDVLWVSEREKAGRQLVIAPLSVAGLMRSRILVEKTVILTSATLRLGGDFHAVAGTVGLLRSEEITEDTTPLPDALAWRGLDVGSPFDYPKQGICYVAKHLPLPARDGPTPEVLSEVAELVWAAGGRTLGLFASQRAAEAAAVHVRKQLPQLTVLCQGDQQLSELLRRFKEEPETSLFGTVSLWQGVDVPGDTCELVIIDKIPFPRPDEPLLLARQRAVTQSGGNGFMQVAASHAALLLAQGSGRLIRRHSDKGVVAVLDPRLLTARYGSFLRASMPDFWMTTNQEIAVGALRRLQQARVTEDLSSG